MASGQGSEGWLSVSSPNGLADVHWLHVGSHNGTSRIDKEKRNVFVKGRIQDVRKQFQVGPVNKAQNYSPKFPIGKNFCFVCILLLAQEFDEVLCK